MHFVLLDLHTVFQITENDNTYALSDIFVALKLWQFTTILPPAAIHINFEENKLISVSNYCLVTILIQFEWQKKLKKKLI